MMLLIAFYAAVLFITAWTLSAVFSASALASPHLPRQSAGSPSPGAGPR